MALSSTLNKALDAEITGRLKGALVIGAFAAAAMLFAAKLADAYLRSERTEAKSASIESVDSTKNFARSTVGPDGKFIRWNAGMTAMFGWTADEMIGQTADRLDPDETADESYVARAIFAPHRTQWEGSGKYLRLRSKNGDLRDYDAVIFDAGGDLPTREITLRIGEPAQP